MTMLTQLQAIVEAPDVFVILRNTLKDTGLEKNYKNSNALFYGHAGEFSTEDRKSLASALEYTLNCLGEDINELARDHLWGVVGALRNYKEKKKPIEWVANLPIEEQIEHYENCIARRKKGETPPYDFTTSELIRRHELEIADLKKRLEKMND